MRVLPEQFDIDKGRIGVQPYLFMSYSHGDARQVYPYFAALQQAGMDIWFDEAIRAGAEWEREIIQYLSAAEGFVFFVTEASLKSQNCMDELYSAKESKKPIINVLMDDIDLTDPEYEWFWFRYSRYQQIPAYAMTIEEVVSKIQKGLQMADESPSSASAGKAKAAPKDALKPDFQKETKAYYRKLRKIHLMYAVLMLTVLAGFIWCVTSKSYVNAILMLLSLSFALIGVYCATGFSIRKSVLIKYRGKAGCVVVPNSVTSIGEKAFYYRNHVVEVVMPDSVTSIGEHAFGFCRSLLRVEMSDSVTAIGDSAFASCISLIDITIPDSVKDIGSFAFSGCSSLINITIPDSVRDIGGFAFSGCSSLTEMELPNSVVSIGLFAFENCNALESIKLPDSLCAIGFSMFNGCRSLTDITIPDSVRDIEGRAFSGCSSLTELELPNSVVSIGSYAFSGCISITNIVLPDSIRTVEMHAFENCNALERITIPSSVTEMGDGVFSGCTTLKWIFCDLPRQPETWDPAWLAGCIAEVHWRENGA